MTAEEKPKTKTCAESRPSSPRQKPTRLASRLPRCSAIGTSVHLARKSSAAPYSGNFSLSELEQIILVTTETDGAISHARIKSFSSVHPKDISTALASLAKNKFLIKKGSTRDSLYYLPNNKALDPFGLFQKDAEIPSVWLGEKLGEKRETILKAMKKEYCFGAINA